MSHEARGGSSEYYTPKYVFDALGCGFDMDVACPADLSHIWVPAKQFIHSDSLNKVWKGFIWMNPPYGNQPEKLKWLDKFYRHGNGIALMPDRTSCQWWQEYAPKMDAILFVNGKIKFINECGQQMGYFQY